MRNTLLIAGFFILFSGCTKEEVKPETSAANLPKLVINEFMSSNSFSYQDPENEGEFDDWIEVYNAGDKEVNLAGLYISDNKNYKAKYKIPASNPVKTTIPPGGYLILWADSDLAQGELHVDFKLSAEGEDLGIYTADGQVIDETTFGPQVNDVSFGRQASGAGIWTTFSPGTPGMPNK
ncbi:hypothetical protein AAE02nite_45400 [Adhaeribacter aerolatus]|uniref:LTD domain-containing protein n=1 Tax=Adhaeribacter aerolatus TaxID=670289 RepID=A0A512B4G8_9BACT|nr:lamin tail domain-containing protein [Adhaeribacter aerolatus]GEO06876.1 hypothetical protein AAE02nite_45400 [Adhaeribacter aerolatus]